MIDPKELLFIVDENNLPLEPKPRDIAHKTGLWHRTTGIWVINEKGQLLCQKRTLWKDVKPGFWEAFFGGHVAPGDSYEYSALLESKEELGIDINKEEIFPYKVMASSNSTHREFQHVFATFINKSVSEFNYEKEEIDELKWIDLDKVRQILSDTNIDNWVKKPWDMEVLKWLEGLKK